MRGEQGPRVVGVEPRGGRSLGCGADRVNTAVAGTVGMATVQVRRVRSLTQAR